MASSNTAHLLYACIAHGTTILTEHTSPGTSSTSASSLASVILPKINHSQPAKLTYTHERLFVHYIADSPNSPSDSTDETPSSHAALTYLVVAPSELGRRIPFAFLLELKRKYLAQYKPDDTDFASEPAYGTAAFNTTLKALVTKFNTTPPEDSLSNAKREIDSVKDIMTENIERVLERGERIDLLVDKTDRLGGSARDFRVRSRGLRRRMWWKNVRLMALLGVVIVFLLYLFIGFGCGLPAWGKCVGTRLYNMVYIVSPVLIEQIAVIIANGVIGVMNEMQSFYNLKLGTIIMLISFVGVGVLNYLDILRA